MQKTNKAILVSFAIIILVVITITACKNTKKDSVIIEKEPQEVVAEISSEISTEVSTQVETTQPDTTAQPSTQSINKVDVSNVNNILFIGDSRTVGLAEYGKLNKADFFANVGMSVYNINDAKVSVPSVGKTTLSNLLNNKKYDRIYIMLGINELGYDTNKTINKYQALIDSVKQNQPNAVIILQANLHVTSERSQKDKNINNKKIDYLNSQIALLSDNKNVYYIDANKLFDDSNNSLSKDKTGDSAHLYAKYYSQWAEWIISQTDNYKLEK